MGQTFGEGGPKKIVGVPFEGRRGCGSTNWGKKRTTSIGRLHRAADLVTSCHVEYFSDEGEGGRRAPRAWAGGVGKVVREF
jgi:hypothetical protein